jgi:hypothetical protein
MGILILLGDGADRRGCGKMSRLDYGIIIFNTRVAGALKIVSLVI